MGSFGLALLVAMALPPRTAGAQIFGSDPEGLKRTDKLIKKAEELVKETVSAREQIGKTLDTYNAIFSEDVEDIRKAYKGVEGEMEKTEKQREKVRKKLEEMKIEADAYFAGWSESLQQIESPDLRQRSEARMAETRGQFDGILDAVDEAREAYGPFMTSMKDQWTYLGHDLNPDGISSLKPDAEKLNEQAKGLFEKIDAGMKKAEEYIESLRSSRPVT
jgi:F0F1-type ATP synthase membrane subunit b/b'